MMNPYPTTHVRTRRETIDEVKAFVTKELNELTRSIGLSVGRMSVAELVAERNAYARMLKFLTALSD